MKELPGGVDTVIVGAGLICTIVLPPMYALAWEQPLLPVASVLSVLALATLGSWVARASYAALLLMPVSLFGSSFAVRSLLAEMNMECKQRRCRTAPTSSDSAA